MEMSMSDNLTDELRYVESSRSSRPSRRRTVWSSSPFPFHGPPSSPDGAVLSISSAEIDANARLTSDSGLWLHAEASSPRPLPRYDEIHDIHGSNPARSLLSWVIGTGRVELNSPCLARIACLETGPMEGLHRRLRNRGIT